MSTQSGSNGQTCEFALSMDLTGPSAIISVRGELDERTAADVCAAIASATDQGSRSVTLDLSEVTYMGAAGLRAVVDCAITLALFGGSLSLRSPSPWVRHILASTGLAGLLPDEPQIAGTENIVPRRPTPSALEPRLREPAAALSQSA